MELHKPEGKWKQSTGKIHPRPHSLGGAELCLKLNLLKQQNTWRNVCRFALSAIHLSWASEPSRVPSPGSPGGAGRVETFITRTHWRSLVPNEQRCPEDNLSRRAVGSSDQKWSYTLLWPRTIALSGATFVELPWAWLPYWSPIDSQHCWQNSYLIYWDPAVAHRSHREPEYGSITIKELYLQPHQRLDNIWTKFFAW
jgi:hypothetical protein